MSNVRDLYAAYPFLPAEEPDDAIKNVLDARVVCILPAGDPIPLTRNIDGIVVELLSLSADLALFGVTIDKYGYTGTASVPVFAGRDAYPDSDSYVIVDQPIEDTVVLTRAYRLHPDCVLVMQDAPTVTIQLRSSISHDYSSSVTSDYTPDDGTALAFVDGYNASVSLSGDVLRWYSTAGAGKGVYESVPYSDFYGTEPKFGGGLRSVNGLRDDVSFDASTSVALSVTRSQSGDETLITIGSNR